MFDYVGILSPMRRPLFLSLLPIRSIEIWECMR